MKIRHFMRKAYFVNILLVLILPLNGCAVARVHPDFDERHKTMSELTILPPSVAAYEITFNAGKKPIAHLKEMIEEKSVQSLREVMSDKGYEIKNIEISGEDLASNPELRKTVFDVQSLFEQAVKDIQKGKKREFIYEIGSSANYFSENHNANVIILSRLVAAKLSAGMIAAQAAQAVASLATALLIGVSTAGPTMPAHSLIADIAIVDADSGDILWYHASPSTHNFEHVPKKEHDHAVYKLINLILKSFPESKFKKEKEPAELKTVPDQSSVVQSTATNFGPVKTVTPTPR